MLLVFWLTTLLGGALLCEAVEAVLADLFVDESLMDVVLPTLLVLLEVLCQWTITTHDKSHTQLVYLLLLLDNMEWHL